MTVVSALGASTGVLLPETALVFEPDRSASVMVFEPSGDDPFEWIETDLSEPDAIAAAFEEIRERELGPVTGLVNNAGVALGGTFDQVSEENFDWLMSINFDAVVTLCRAFLPLLRQRPEARIVNISSLFGLITPAGQTAYCASKFAVRGFTEALRQEMKLENQPVAVSCVHPGGIRTNIVNAARMGKSENAVAQRKGFDKLAMTTPEKAAEIIVKGILKNESRILVGPDAWGIDAINRLLGSAYQPLVERFSRKNLYI